MPQVIKADVVQRGSRPDPTPRPVYRRQVPTRNAAGDHPRCTGYARPVRQHACGRSRQRSRARSRLAVAQPQLPALQIHHIRPQPQEFPAPAHGEHQQPYRGRGVRRHLAPSLGVAQHPSQPREFRLHQKPLTPSHLVPGNMRPRVFAFSDQLPRLGHAEHRRPRIDHARGQVQPNPSGSVAQHRVQGFRRLHRRAPASLGRLFHALRPDAFRSNSRHQPASHFTDFRAWGSKKRSSVYPRCARVGRVVEVTDRACL